MASEITMPKLSDTMTEGQLGVWLKNVGDRISRGDVIAEVETDKSVMDLEAFTSGILLEQRVQSGQLVPVGTVLGLIGETGEMVTRQTDMLAEAPSPAVANVTAPGIAAVAASATETSDTGVSPPFARPGTGEIQVSPVVRRRATELGIDLHTLTGSGPGGRIMLEDLQRPMPAGSLPEVAAAEPPSAVTPPEAQPVSRLRNAIARTTVTAWQSTPHFYMTRDIEMDKTAEIIQGLAEEGEQVSLNSLIMVAAASALTSFPALNGSFGPSGIILNSRINLSFAVALDDGLQMPVIKGAELMGVRELSLEVARLVAKARKGSLKEDEITGGSFSISNLGMYGVNSLASIIMPGQAAILGIGAITERPVVHNGRIVTAPVVTVTLSCDHRIIDGAIGAGFLNEFKRLLEHPAELPA